MLNPEDEADLIELSHHWGEAYDLAVLDDVWTAHAMGNPLIILTADTAGELRAMVRADYEKATSTTGRPGCRRRTISRKE